MSAKQASKYIARVCMGTGCISNGSLDVYEALKRGSESLGLKNVIVEFSGCHGFCQRGPVVDIEPGGIFYCEVKVKDVEDILRLHFQEGKLVERLFYRDPVTGVAIPCSKDIPFYSKQHRIILRNCGHINPEDIDSYIASGGYVALKKALGMKPEEIIEEIRRSGLRGRGGAGFPTGQKWAFCREAPGAEKYIICNADEGDPGAFMDRSVLEADPHSVLEGMVIGAYAIGANHGYIYCRAEYPLALQRLRLALKQMEEHGFIGNNILGSGFSFDIKIKEGAGAFVCGEETALIASIEGKRGMPRPRPPFPAQSGLWGKPTVINNVKTWATIPVIIAKGAEWYASIGTEKSKGTVVFALTGKIANSGLVEVPMGIKLAELIYGIGGGIPRGKKFKAVQTGGPSGGCLPASMLNSPVDYESLTAAGSIMGSGGMVIADEDTCMVDLARYFLSFTQAESCGKCPPCRVGTRQMLGILERITRGEGRPGDIEQLERIAMTVKQGSLCGLGQTAPNPVLTTLRYFREEYEEHIKKHRCRAAACKGLVKAPCSHTCPAGIEVPRYVRFIQKGMFSEACAVIREKVPFPGVLGRVCFHPCELKCRRGELDEAVAIKALKRIAADHDTGLWKKNIKPVPPTGKRVAVVGSGPAGLTAAYYLARRGHSVTVFESLPQPGGMMRVGIPEYRLPRRILDAEIDEIRKAGVEIRVNTKVESVQSLLDEGYNAVFIAVGAHRGVRMGVDGEDSEGIWECVDLLRRVNLGEKVAIGRRVGVVGGGNAAIDAARTALRIGAKEVTVIYRRTQAEMPASPEEVAEAVHEGVRFLFLVAPTRVSRENSALKMECIKMELGDFDASGRRRPVPVKGSEFTLDFDTIIVAIGQTPHVPDGFGLPVNRDNTLQVDTDTLMTVREGVFAGGDCVSGPASVIEAIAAGRQAAISIDRYLGGSGVIDELLAPVEEPALPPVEEGEKSRPSVAVLPVSRRAGNFDEVELGFSPELAIEESKRCLRCDLERE